MAESSIFWTTGSTGDGASTYTQAQITDWLRRTFVSDNAATQGVLVGYNNNLAVTGTSSPVAVNTGAAIVYGFPYENTASVNVAVSTPVIGTTGHRVVLRASWAAQTVRIALLSASDGVATPPAVTQTAATTWEISLATLTITTGGVITVTDTRSYCSYPTRVTESEISASVAGAGLSGGNGVVLSVNVDDVTLQLPADTISVKADGIGNTQLRNSGALSVIGRSANSTGDPADISAVAASGAVLRESGSTLGFGTIATAGIAADAADITIIGNKVPGFLGRQGGSATIWSTGGTNNYTTTIAPRVQMGCIEWAGSAASSGSIAITFPVAFSYAPVVFAGSINSYAVCNPASITTTGCSLDWRDTAGTLHTGIYLTWQAWGAE